MRPPQPQPSTAASSSEGQVACVVSVVCNAFGVTILEPPPHFSSSSTGSQKKWVTSRYLRAISVWYWTHLGRLGSGSSATLADGGQELVVLSTLSAVPNSLPNLIPTERERDQQDHSHPLPGRHPWESPSHGQPPGMRIIANPLSPIPDPTRRARSGSQGYLAALRYFSLRRACWSRISAAKTRVNPHASGQHGVRSGNGEGSLLEAPRRSAWISSIPS